MKIYEKVVRRLMNTDGDIRSIIKSDTLRKIRKDIEILKNEGITFGIEPLCTSNLMDFYTNIYIPIIGQKQNAKTDQILTTLNQEEIDKNIRFFIFIRKGDTLLGGGIFKHLDKKLSFGYKGNNKEEISLKAGFGTLIDFLFFSFGIDHSVDYFSYGIDRNGYGDIGSAHGIFFHKLLLGFMPYTFPTNNIIEIDESVIHNPTIIFDDANQKGAFHKAILLHTTDNEKKYIDVLTKKGFSITNI